MKIADRRTSSGAEKRTPKATPAKVETAAEREKRIADAAVASALQYLGTFMQKMTTGHEPNAPELRGAVFGSILIADRNTVEHNERMKWVEHNWLWRLFHRSQKPKRT